MECPFCGEPMKVLEDGTAVQCTGCGFKEYNSEVTFQRLPPRNGVILKVYPEQSCPFQYFRSVYGKLERIRSSRYCPHGFYMGVHCPEGCHGIIERGQNITLYQS